MRFGSVFSSFAIIQIVIVFGEENFLNDESDESAFLNGWTTQPDIGSELLVGNMDVGQLTQDTNFNFASLPTSEESSTDYWASCSSGGLGLGARDDSLCQKKEDVPTLPTLGDIENAVVNPLDPEPEKQQLPQDKNSQFYQEESKCRPMNPLHLCCICDGQFMWAVCQDCIEYLGFCLRPHIQVCCYDYGMKPNPGSGSMVDDYLDEGSYKPNLNTLGGVLAQDCIPLQSM